MSNSFKNDELMILFDPRKSERDPKLERHVKTYRQPNSAQVMNGYWTGTKESENSDEPPHPRLGDFQDTTWIAAHGHKRTDQRHEYPLILRIERDVKKNTALLR
jgi:hypothetical protein